MNVISDILVFATVWVVIALHSEVDCKEVYTPIIPLIVINCGFRTSEMLLHQFAFLKLDR